MPEGREMCIQKSMSADSHEDEVALVSTRALPVTMMEADGSEKEEKLCQWG